MDLEDLTPAEKVNVCKKYFFGGFAFLPFLWLVNAIWFYKEAYKKPEYAEQVELRKYVRFSSVGAFIGISLLISWIVVFQVYRVQWGELADYISFTFPVGRI